MSFFNRWFGGRDQIELSPIDVFEQGVVTPVPLAQVSPLVQAAVDRIVSRAGQAEFKIEGNSNMGLSEMVRRPGPQSSSDFYSTVITEMLLYGAAYLYRDIDGWRVGSTPTCDIIRPERSGTDGYTLRIDTDPLSPTGQVDYPGGGPDAFVVLDARAE